MFEEFGRSRFFFVVWLYLLKDSCEDDYISHFIESEGRKEGGSGLNSVIFPYPVILLPLERARLWDSRTYFPLRWHHEPSLFPLSPNEIPWKWAGSTLWVWQKTSREGPGSWWAPQMKELYGWQPEITVEWEDTRFYPLTITRTWRWLIPTQHL